MTELTGAALFGRHLGPIPGETTPPDPVDEEAARELEEQRALERETAEQVRRLRAVEEAKRVMRAERRMSPPASVSLRELLDEPEEEETWRLEGLMPTEARVMLAAPYKVGKSTFGANLIRSLVDSEPFLGRFAPAPLDGPVVLIDNELSRKMLRRWLREQGITAVDSVYLFPLRGRVSSFDLLDPEALSQWASKLAALGARYLILDCLRPVLDALGLDEHKEAGKFLTAFDELLERAGVPEALVVHHAGHTADRARGDSRLRDWPDVEWHLMREDKEDDRSVRFFSAFGRDVDQPEAALSYDADTRRLTLTGGARGDAAAEETAEAIVALLSEKDGLSGRGIEKDLPDIPDHKVRAGLTFAHRRGMVSATKKGRANLWHVTGGLTLDNLEDSEPEGDSPSGPADDQADVPMRQRASDVRQRTPRACVSALVDDARTRPTDAEGVRQADEPSTTATKTTSPPPPTKRRRQRNRRRPGGGGRDA